MIARALTFEIRSIESGLFVLFFVLCFFPDLEAQKVNKTGTFQVKQR